MKHLQLGIFCLLVMLAMVDRANAVPILIQQNHGEAIEPLVINGVSQTVSGDWIFKILTDSTNPDLDGDPDVGAFDATISVSSPARAR